MSKPLTSKILNSTVIVAGLGYFVDIYDLQLFNIIGKESIQSPAGLNVSDPLQVANLFDNNLFYWQMAGMLVGGLFWGIYGDRKGRKSILFGSILMYSVANLLNAFVTTVEQYQTVRFLAGLGLAGELGAAITLVSEIMTKENRGWGTAIIVTLGALGAVAAALIANFKIALFGLEAWQTAYIIGGVLGLLLLLLRFGTFESGMFEQLEKKDPSRGNFFMLFQDRERFFKYLHCISIGLPVWFVLGTLVKRAPGYAEHIGTATPVSVATAVMMAYLGLSIGDLFSGFLSQVMRSRRKVVLIYLILSMTTTMVYVFSPTLSASGFYILIFILGVSTGYWALFVTIASEQFGTNIRATATTTIPNFVRGAVIPIGVSFAALLSQTSSLVSATLIVGGVCFGLAIFSILSLPETFGKSLDYLE
ncbi:MFS transporter [Haliscomenobacter hydrossis]|uniref:Major facilitator superfamily MFS_1 n=1 Tax=Haliscomenobacter hydrossis (strain ATCC 27775 / DSM 1100 / LMG 10767 / O) TaxID=760192 RepID=F4KZN4_HALH1|nr:MFS transporter [Haliscomenobacter hydrossis]AEE50470.1 major facilitator superfamily MFS_1 [Haliscomenobacter hydrossis DSM 1100]